MYSVKKEDGRTIVCDWLDKIVWSSPDDAYVLYTSSIGPNKGNATVAKVGTLSDEQLLTALASAVKLAL